jgi:chitinase
MSPSTLSRAAAVATLLASTASAALNAASSNNVVVYWGQGYDQKTLSDVCQDPSYDVVTLGFVTGFPMKVGDYPTTNFGNACAGDTYEHPSDPTQNGKLLKTCGGIEPGIQKCRENGKTVLLSLGGGDPNNYYLPSEEVAKYFAKFLIGAFGPKSSEWTGPRPFGDEFVDGFDLDLEADAGKVPSKEYIYANYAYLVNQLKEMQPSLLITAAPQCVVPDVRLADAITNAPFDMIFTQFYNTDECSARLGYEQRGEATTGFTFNKWAEWLQTNSKNKAVKLYMGLPAGEAGAPYHKTHYLSPMEANLLANKWRAAYPTIFGGIMLWEAKVSSDNVVNCKNYGYWMKAALEGRFSNEYTNGCVTSSSTVASSTIASATPTATLKSPNGLCGDQ